MQGMPGYNQKIALQTIPFITMFLDFLRRKYLLKK